MSGHSHGPTVSAGGQHRSRMLIVLGLIGLWLL